MDHFFRTGNCMVGSTFAMCLFKNPASHKCVPESFLDWFSPTKKQSLIALLLIPQLPLYRVERPVGNGFAVLRFATAQGCQ